MTRTEARKQIKDIIVARFGRGVWERSVMRCFPVSGAAPKQYQADIKTADAYHWTFLVVRKPTMTAALTELVRIVRAAYGEE